MFRTCTCGVHFLTVHRRRDQRAAQHTRPLLWRVGGGGHHVQGNAQRHSHQGFPGGGGHEEMGGTAQIAVDLQRVQTQVHVLRQQNSTAPAPKQRGHVADHLLHVMRAVQFNASGAGWFVHLIQGVVGGVDVGVAMGPTTFRTRGRTPPKQP